MLLVPSNRFFSRSEDRFSINRADVAVLNKSPKHDVPLCILPLPLSVVFVSITRAPPSSASIINYLATDRTDRGDSPPTICNDNPSFDDPPDNHVNNAHLFLRSFDDKSIRIKTGMFFRSVPCKNCRFSIARPFPNLIIIFFYFFEISIFPYMCIYIFLYPSSFEFPRDPPCPIFLYIYKKKRIKER